MKWKDYDLKDWNKFKIDKEIESNNTKVLLLNINRTVMPPEKGRKNLIAVDKDENIKWIAELPKSYPMFGSYHDVKLENNKLMALCGSTWCEIEIETGKILNDKFVK